MGSLKADLVALRQELASSTPEDVSKVLQRATQRLVESGIADSASGVGDRFPDFALPNVVGNAISSQDLLRMGPLVVSFYRGGWCPYCNLELRAYQAILPEIRDLGADFVAISPQQPDESLTMAAKSNLNYEILCDTGNSLAEHLGLMYELPAGVVDLYRSMGHDLERINGNMQWTLPLPATYVLDQDNNIVLAHVNADHSVRLEPQKALACLKKL
jgi:peroxiredoxin